MLQGHGSVLSQLPCQVIACVQKAEFRAWQHAAGLDPKRTAPFMAYALAAASEALEDSGLAFDTQVSCVGGYLKGGRASFFCYCAARQRPPNHIFAYSGNNLLNNT